MEGLGESLCIVVFAHSLMYKDPDRRKKLISSLLCHPRPFYKVSPESIHYVLSHFAYRQLTVKQANATEDLTSLAKEVMSVVFIVHPYNRTKSSRVPSVDKER